MALPTDWAQALTGWPQYADPVYQGGVKRVPVCIACITRGFCAPANALPSRQQPTECKAASN